LKPRPERAVKTAFMARSDSGADNPGMRLPSLRFFPGLARSGGTLLALLLLVPGAHASGDRERDRDHERARAAVQAGQVLPLATLLQQLQRSHPGQVLEVELERDDGRWIYEIKLLQGGGQLLKLELDAATGQVLKARSRPAPSARPAP
jgi:hypothetical protein